LVLDKISRIGKFLGWQMVKWLASLMLLFAVTGHIWAGACVCFDEHSDEHSCCKPDESGNLSLSGKSCCSSDCEAIAGSEIPSNKSSERVSPELTLKESKSRPSVISWVPPLPVVERKSASTNRLGHRLKFARPPAPLYLRHHSFLI
jgi:hypothetical protein